MSDTGKDVDRRMQREAPRMFEVLTLLDQGFVVEAKHLALDIRKKVFGKARWKKIAGK